VSGSPSRAAPPARERLSIALVYDHLYPEDLGGVEHRNRELARALARRGHLVTLVAWTRRRGELEPGVRVAPVGRTKGAHRPGGRRSSLRALRFALDCARLDLAQFDVVETANIPYAHLPVLALRCRRAGKPLVVTWYEYWGRYWREYVGWKWPLWALAETLCASLGTSAWAVSELTRSRLTTRRRSVGTTRIGIPVATIRAAAEGPVDRGPPLVYAGRLIREKRVDLLLRAVAVLAEERAKPELLATIVGEGPERRPLQSLATELGIASRVVFTGKLGSAEEVWRVLASATLAVHPSSREGYGMFALEAMALGLPVITCEATESAVPELARPGIEGETSAATPEALAATLGRLLDDPDRRTALAAAAKARSEEFRWEPIAAATERSFRELVAVCARWG
jgi:glycosyltransferase involved in cell wall biosynthesis